MPYGDHSSFPKAILHIDGDAFFASCEQSLDPRLKGKPVITGKERGIAASMSYEAIACGVRRGMRFFEIKKMCPDAIFLPSDYETYSILSKRFYDIVRRYTSEVEEYGVDECFADLTGLRRPLRMSYPRMAECIQNDLFRELGFTFSIGLAPTKVLAKTASRWKKPHGLTIISKRNAPVFLAELLVRKIWGVGPQTGAFLNKLGVYTALEFARRPEEWVTRTLTKPHYEIWQELNGVSVMPISTELHEEYYSIQKFKTFTPPSSERLFVFAQLSKNIESACIKLRRHHQAAREIGFFLRTQSFDHYGISAVLSRPSSFAHEVVTALEKVFDKLWRPGILFRQTGVVFSRLEGDEIHQPDLFGSHLSVEKYQRLYTSVDELAAWYGKHTVYLGSSFSANKFAQHLGSRGDLPQRKLDLFKHETKRKRLGIPLFSLDDT